VKIKSQRDFFAGLMFCVVGTAFAWGAASNYAIGQGARMGPGYFPLALGVLLTILGLVVVFKALVVQTEDGEPVGSFAWKPLVYVLGANLAFGVLLGGLPKLGIPAMGLILAIYALVFIASLAADVFLPKQIFLLATGLAIGCYLAFIVLLKLQMPVWPTFITG
jgi:hypothetical protein